MTSAKPKVERLDRAFFDEAVALIPGKEDRDDMAVPSYAHSNPLIPWVFWKRLDVIVSCFAKARYGAVLDYGCGTGTLLPTLSKIADSVSACDIRTAIAAALVAKLQLPNVQTMLPEAFRAMPHNSLDLIVSADVLEHVENLDEIIGNFRALLKPGGELVISGPTESRIYAMCRRIAGFSGHYHVSNILDIDRTMQKTFKKTGMVKVPLNLPWPFPSLFHICSYVKE